MNGYRRSPGASEISTLLMVRILGAIQANGRCGCCGLYDILGAKSRGLMRIMVRRYGCRSVNKLFPTNGDLPKLTPCNIASD